MEAEALDDGMYEQKNRKRLREGKLWVSKSGSKKWGEGDGALWEGGEEIVILFTEKENHFYFRRRKKETIAGHRCIRHRKGLKQHDLSSASFYLALCLTKMTLGKCQLICI